MKKELEDRKKDSEMLSQIIRAENENRIKDHVNLKKQVVDNKAEVDETLKHLDQVTIDLEEDIERLSNDLKMGLEEEKMLRGQDIGILKFNLTEGVDEMKGLLEDHKSKMSNCIEEERDERINQTTDLLNKIDTEKRDRASSISRLSHQMEDDQGDLKKDMYKLKDLIETNNNATLQNHQQPFPLNKIKCLLRLEALNKN